MASLGNSTFTRYNLSVQEILQGTVLSPQQIQVIQNECADIADQLINLTFDPINPTQVALDQAYLKGQLAAFQLLPIRSEEAFRELQKLSVQS